ncbi:DUF1287 domain-containing protein [Nonlabens sp. SCSIO 43208]|uniref:DUF1287 domain-containing protein n=1 Tax=Nonlabens sp. SCSIO 43208 TaxID=2793009 RepID=UPI003D6ADF47
MLFKLKLILFFLSALPVCHLQQDFSFDLAVAAEQLTKDEMTYNGSYFSIPYPNGDIPAQYGVCTDVVIRAYRKVGIDLQQLVHEDMKENFKEYPQLWGLKKPDTNIDHRRVPNLGKFFERNGTILPISKDKSNYLPGDVVTWVLTNNMTHIGIISTKKDSKTGNPLVVHNIGAGQVLEDCLFKFTITGHYKYGK